MASTFTLTATAQSTASPPSVRLVVGQSGTPALTSVTITRTDAAGNSFPVRTPDGDTLAISGGSAVAIDTEAPYGRAVTYTVAANNQPTATATLAVTRPWLVHIGIPKRSVSFTMARGGANPSETWTIPQGVFPILGSAYPIVISGGARQAPAMTLPVVVQTAADALALRVLLADGAPLLLNAPPGYGLDSQYIAVGNVTNEWLSPLVSDTGRTVALPYQVTARPGGAMRAPLTFADLTYSSWSAIPAGTTWTQLLS